MKYALDQILLYVIDFRRICKAYFSEEEIIDFETDNDLRDKERLRKQQGSGLMNVHHLDFEQNAESL
jgi:hypothetical protein